LITLGTGIGGGLLLDGRLRYGPQGSVGEIGPMLLPIPSLAAPVSIESLAAPGSIMKQLGDQKGRLFERLRQGDPLAARLAEEMFQAVGMTIANIHMLLGLELVLIFGGIASEGEELLDGFRREFARICPPIYHYGLRIGFGSLPADTAGVIGAACHWFERQGLLPSLHYGE
jgi:glucokinase